MFFDDWQGIARVFVVGTLAYAALVLLLRVTGKRTLSKMNAFDLVVTVALGSTFATIVLSKDVALAEGVAAFALLIGLQFVVAALSTRSAGFRRLIKAEPRLVFHNGRMLHEALRHERVVEAEILAAIRQSGKSDLAQIAAVVLETDGSFSVLARRPGAEGVSALQTVVGPSRDRGGSQQGS